MPAPEFALTIRAMRICDVAAILRIQRACYVPHMNESQPVIEHRLSVSPETAWVAERVAARVVPYQNITLKRPSARGPTATKKGLPPNHCAVGCQRERGLGSAQLVQR